MEKLLCVCRIVYRNISYFFRFFSSQWLFFENKIRYINDFIDLSKSYELFITHNLHGGTEVYASNYLKDKKDVLLMFNIRGWRDLLYCMVDCSTKRRIYIKPSKVESLIKSIIINKITVNSLVTYSKYKKIIELLLNYTRTHNNFLVYLMHDYHCVCPRYYLVVDDQFCNLKCSIYNCRFINTVDYTNTKIEEWRIVWYNFLQGCCEIRCFSESTKTIFKSAYPAIDDKKLLVIPHDISYCNFDPIVIDHSEFHIGIIGTCATVQKGCNIVRNFLKYMKNINIKITIIGRMHSWDKTPSKNINYINGYVRNELPGLIEKNHISAVLFPSICPETFSYLISELMLLKLPIVCFNCGAQAEKIRKYARGIICNNTNPKDILLSLQSAYDSLKRVYSCGNK